MQINAQKILQNVLKAGMLELKLVNCGIVPQECIRISSSDQVIDLCNLDLSCNPIGFQGLCNLLNAKQSKLSKIQQLKLFSCELDNGF